MTTVGLIGLGAMGSGMAASLRRAGHSVQVFDVRREVAAAFAQDGGVAHDSLASLGAACDVIVSVVVNAAQTEAVLFGDGSTPGCAASMKPGSVFVMCSTVDPNWSVALEARLEAMGLRYVDAPISGGAAKAASGQMTMMTAGKPEAYAVAEPLYSSQVVIVAGVSHPLARAVRLAQLQECACVLSSPSRGPGAVIEEAFQTHGLGMPRVSMLCESFLALPAVVAASNQWVTTMPRILFENSPFKEKLCIVPIEDELPSPLICTVRRHDLPLTPAAIQLIGWIQHFALKRL